MDVCEIINMAIRHVNSVMKINSLLVIMQAQGNRYYR